MKNIFIKTYTFMGILFALSSAHAHFGSKGPFGGSVNTATASATTVYIGTDDGGVYESTDTTLNAWRARPVGLKSGKIVALAHTGSYLFAATNEGVYSFTGYDGSDRYWIRKSSGLENLNVTSLFAVDSITLFAGVSGDPGIYLTRDKGNTWTKADGSIMHHYQVTGIVKAGNRIIHSSWDGGLWASNDLGVSWYDFNDDYTLHIEGTSTLSYNATTDEVMVINVNGLYKAKVGTGNDPVFSKVVAGLPNTYEIRSLTNDGNNWYLATDKGIFVSPANAIAWAAANTGLTTSDVTVVVPFKNLLLAGTRKEGIYKVDKALLQTGWGSTKTGFNNLVTHAGVTWGTDVAVAATEKGVFVSRNVTASVAIYDRANKGLKDSLNVNDLVYAEACLLAATKGSGVFFSTDTGKTWTEVSNGLVNKDIRKLFVYKGVKYAICSNGNLYSSPLHSYDWISELHDLPTGVKATALVQFGNNLLLGTENNGVYVKPVSSMNWVLANTNLGNLKVSALVVQKEKVLLGTDGNGIWVADTTTLSWSATPAINIEHVSLVGLDPSRIQALALNGNFAYASFKGGVAATYDFGKTWVEAGAQFNLPTFTNVRKIFFVDPKGTAAGRVFVTTDNNGLYSNSLSEIKDPTFVWDENISLGMAVVPNPNEGSFSFMENGNEIQSVVIADAQGRIVVSLDKVPSFVSLDLQKGLYLVRIATKQGIQTEKMVVK